MARSSNSGAIPAMNAPMAEFMQTRHPGVSADGRYLVLPTGALHRLSPAVQAQLVHALGQAYAELAAAPWPDAYTVDAVAWRRIVEVPEIDENGELVHREIPAGQPVPAEATTRRALAPTADPLAPPPTRPQAPTPPPPPAATEAPARGWFTEEPSTERTRPARPNRTRAAG